MKEAPFCSVVIPVFNAEKSLSELIGRTVSFFEKHKISYEVILVNDGSGDGSWRVIHEMSRMNSNIVGIDLLRNYGQHNAMHCGFRQAKGEYVVTVDDDLQNPPEEIAKLISKSKEGYDLVIGRYASKRHSFYRKIGSQAVGFLNEKIFRKPSNLVMSNFRIIHRSVIERVLGFPGANPYIPGLLILYSGRAANVIVEHEPRRYGRSHYGLGKILRVIFSILFSYSIYPLRSLVVAGTLTAAFSFVLAVCFLLRGLLHAAKVPGWTSIAVMVSFFSGFIILLLGVVGEYVLQISRTLNQPASYHIREISGHA